MFNWLKGIYNGTVGALSTIEKWIVGALNAVYSYLGNLISQLWTSVQQILGSVGQYIDKLEKSLYSLYSLVQWVITKGIPDLANWAASELAKLADYAKGVYNWALSELGRIESWALGELDKLAQWVLRNVWDPLWNAIASAVKWIENEGAYVYYLVTHPDKLAQLLAEYALSQWLNLGRRFAKPFIKWLVHNIIAEVPTVSSIIEDIIASLF